MTGKQVMVALATVLIVGFVLGFTVGRSTTEPEKSSDWEARVNLLFVCAHAELLVEGMTIWEERFKDELLQANPAHPFSKDIWERSYKEICESNLELQR